MSVKNKMDEMMESIVVEEELKERIMNQTVRKGKHRFHIWNVWQSVAAVVALLLVLGSVTAVAAGVTGHWNANVAEEFEADKEVQDKLLKEEYARDFTTDRQQGEILQVKDNGVTVTVKQTLTDKYGMYIFLEVEIDKKLGIKLDMDCLSIGPYLHKQIKGVEYTNYSAGFVDLKKKSPYKMGYEFHMLNDNGKECDMRGKEISLHLKNLLQSDDARAGKEKVILKGEWNLKWKVKSNNKTIQIPVNQTVKKWGTTYDVKTVELSPLSSKVIYKCNGRGEEEDKLDVIYIMKDGTKYNDPANEDSWIDGGGCFTEEGHMFAFIKVLDIDNLKSIIIQGKEIPVQS